MKTAVCEWGAAARRVWRGGGRLALTALALAGALGLAGLAARLPLLQTGERLTVDGRLRLRRALAGAPDVQPPLTLLAVDDQALEAFGGTRSGLWTIREPYRRQLAIFDEALQPSVLGFDLIFSRSLDAATVGAEMPDNNATTPEALAALSRWLAMRGDELLAQQLAAVAAHNHFPVLTGYKLRGGAVDPQTVAVPAWGTNEVVGTPPDGRGAVVPYLIDVRIPDACVHFADPARRAAYHASSNAMMPSDGVLNYSWPGYLNAPRDDDGVVRRAPAVLGFDYRDGGTGAVRRAFVPSFGLMAALLHFGVKFPLSDGPAAPVEVSMGRELTIRAPRGVVRRLPLDDAGNIWLDFRRGFEDLTNTVSLAEFDVGYLKPRVDGRIVMVGAVAAGMGDVGATPLSTRTPFVHVHATLALNVLEGRALRPLFPWETAGLALGLWLAASAVAWRWRPAALAAAAAAGLVALGVAAQAALVLAGVLLPVVWPTVFVVLASVTAIGLRYATSERERRRIRAIFAPLVSEPVLAFLEARPGQIALSGERREVSVLMLDIVRFATLTEHLAPEQVTRVINAWYGPATDAILECGGYVDKYIGDAIMAVWGAPYPSATHAVDACRAALAQAVALTRVNAALQQECGVTLRMRAAIGSGPVVAGLFGCGRRMQYSVMGHTVNLASRLEPLNTDYGTAIVIDAATRAAIGDAFVTRWLDDVQLAGLSDPTAVYELVGMRGEVSAGRLAWIGTFESARRAYVGRRWAEARAQLESLPAQAHDPAVSELLARLAIDEHTPPPPGWRGEHLRVEKG